jgi:hypothetical protein
LFPALRDHRWRIRFDQGRIESADAVLRVAVEWDAHDI